MVDFPQTVAIPSSYGPGLADFSAIANAPNTYYQGVFNKQQEQLNQAKLEQMKQQTDLAKAFAGGLPTDPQTGGIDYRKAAAILAAKGDIGGAVSLLQNQPAPMSPMLGGSQSPSAPAPSAAAPTTQMAQPSSVQARPLPAPRANSPQGDSGDNTITSIVTDKLPDQNQTTGQTIMKIAQVMGIDPNANLTPGQMRRAQGLVKRYAPDIAGMSAASSRSTPGGDLPPSANASTPSAISSPRPQNPMQPPVQQPAPVRPEAPSPGPIGPQVPLPQGYTDPQDAILALRREAARLSAYPRAQGQVAELNDWAQRIEQSIKPMAIHPGETLIDPRTGRTILQGQPTNASNIALQRFLAENPNATPEQIQAFVQSGRAGRSAISMYMTRYMQEHPDASADDIKRAAQQYTTQTTAQNRFLSGPQGNTIRSLNVVVSHLQTMQSLGDALKNGNTRMFNSWAQRFAEETGNPAPTNFDTAKQIVGAEVIKALGVAGAGSQSERQEAADAFNRARSPAQLAGAIDAARKLLVGQLQGLRRQYVASTGLPAASFDQMLEPETRSFFDQEDSEKNKGSASGGVSQGGTTTGGLQWSIVQP